MATQNVIGKNLVYTNETDGYTISGGNSTRTITITGSSVSFSSLVSNLTGTSADSYSINSGGTGGILYFDDEVGMALSGTDLTIGTSSHTVIIAGNLTVNGTTTTVNTETINLADNIIVLNSNYAGGTPSENGGIEVERGSIINASLLWDEASDVWKAGVVGSEIELVNISSTQSLSNKTMGSGCVWNGGTIDGAYVDLTLEEISDVSVSGVLDGQVLKYQSGVWVPHTLSGGHAQNTDTGTDQATFTIDSDANAATETLAFGHGGSIAYTSGDVMTITATTSMALTNGTTSLTLSGGTITAGTWNGSAVGPTYGGTGINSYTLGDLLYSSASNTLAKLAGNTTTTKQFLSQTGTGSVSAAPSWSTVSKSDVGLGNVENTALSTWAGSTNITTLGTVATGTWQATSVKTGYGGTGVTSYTAGDILYYASGTALSKLAKGTANQVIGMNSGATAPEYKTVSGSGGTTVTHGANSISISSHSPGADTGTTGASFAINSDGAPASETATLLFGNAATHYVRWNFSTSRIELSHTATLTAGSGSTWNGTAIGPTYGGTNQTTWTTGDLLYASASNTLSKRAIGSSGDVLTVSGGVPTWAAPATPTGITGTTNSKFTIDSGNAASIIELEFGTDGAQITSDQITNSMNFYQHNGTSYGKFLFYDASNPFEINAGVVTNGTWNGTAIGPTYGGTNQTTWTTGDLLYASGSNTLAKRAIGTTGQVLTVSSGVPTWSDAPNISGTPSNTFTINSDSSDSNIATLSLGVANGSVSVNSTGTVTIAPGSDDIVNINATTVNINSASVNDGEVTASAYFGTWSGDTITTAKGGTGLTSIGSANQVLGVNSAGNALEYKTMTWVNTWTEVTGTTQAASINTAYVTNNVAQVTVTLPSTAAFGSVIKIVGKGTGGWRLAQNAGQVIYFGESNTTTGATGYIASTHQRDCVEVTCIGANTIWQVVSSVGNITFV